MRMAYVPDNPDMFARLKASEYLNFIADIYEVTTADRQARIEAAASKAVAIRNWPSSAAPTPDAHAAKAASKRLFEGMRYKAWIRSMYWRLHKVPLFWFVFRALREIKRSLLNAR